jgi:phosphoglycolate phosphatase
VSGKPVFNSEVKMKNKIKGIIFDMDNTLLRSAIDFDAMKRETFEFLVANGILDRSMTLENHTTATVIAEAVGTNKMTDELLRKMWEIPKKHEVCGMKEAGLEPGVAELLARLSGKYLMAVVNQ